MNSSDRVEAALAALPKATPGPWHQGPYYQTDVESAQGTICECKPFETVRGRTNAILIAAAPDLAAEVIRLRAEVARIKTIIADCDGPKEVNKNGL